MDITLIPQSAPFSPEQRAWLNGFLAGWIGLTPPAGGIGAASGSTSLAKPAETPPEAEPEPWHDPALALGDRLALAGARPLPKRLMAAMAQLDCGACGYLCRTYSEAIANGSEKRLSLCSPGGSETAKAIKALLKETAEAPAPATNGVSKNGAPRNGVARTDAPRPTLNGWSREQPFTASLIRAQRLSGAGSEKSTHHVEIALGSDGPTYQVGDSLGIYPENCGQLVDEIVTALGARGDEPVTTSSGVATTLREALGAHCCLSQVEEPLLGRLAATSTEPEASAIRALIDDDAPIAGFDVLDLLRRYPKARPGAADFVAALAAVRPRLYSISSSPLRHHGQVHLTVRRVTYPWNNRERKGVASTMLADRLDPGAQLRVFVQKSHGFRLPNDPTTPAIMIGPGTGVAPFRAFLHERDATGANGRNWLFFGDQRSAHDYLYQDELADFVARGVLTRLDTAFSRDQDAKVYVQDRILEQGAALFDWLQDGAYIYVCGDAKRMASDVDRALRAVVRREGKMTEESARAYVAGLSASGRYLRDVY